MAAEKTGRPRTWKLSFLVDCLLSHFEVYFVQRAMLAQPFMVGLGAEALIEYYDLTGDVRIPPLLRVVADELWNGYWDPVSQSMIYIDFNNNNARLPSHESSMLVVPLFGWLFQKTGISLYRERGDQAFAAATRSLWLEGGKQFSQTYRWSPFYVEWRQSPASPCNYALGATSAQVLATGGMGFFNVVTAGGCSWTATASAGWITATPSGSGPASITYTVAANQAASTRSGTITVAGQVFTINQAAAAAPDCSGVSLSPSTVTASALGGTGSVSVTAPPGCAWAAVTEGNWFFISAGSSGSGPGVITLTMPPNRSRVGRTGSIRVGSLSAAVRQTAKGN
jgi:hypothetical protein